METRYNHFMIQINNWNFNQLVVLQQNRHIHAAYLIDEKGVNQSYLGGFVLTHLDYKQNTFNMIINKNLRDKPVLSGICTLNAEATMIQLKNKKKGSYFGWTHPYPTNQELTKE